MMTWNMKTVEVMDGEAIHSVREITGTIETMTTMMMKTLITNLHTRVEITRETTDAEIISMMKTMMVRTTEGGAGGVTEDQEDTKETASLGLMGSRGLGGQGDRGEIDTLWTMRKITQMVNQLQRRNLEQNPNRFS